MVPTCADDVAQERLEKVNQRYVSLLKRNPREGTAFDRVYSFHSDRGTLEEFTQQIQEAVTKNPDDGAGWMLLGMLATKARNTAEAVTAFENAARLRDDDAVASWYLGRSLLAAGQASEAAAAFEKSLDRNPTRPDQQEIFRSLARVYQRMRKTDKSLETWYRYEVAFPGDASVQEEITAALIEANRSEDALQRLTSLAAKTRDPGKAIQLGVRASALQQELGRIKESRQTLQELSERIKPGSWMHSDLRRRLDDTFLRSGDYAGIIAHYQNVLSRQPDDLDAMTRLARFLEISGDPDGALVWLQKAVAKAPADAKPREALIAYLSKQEKVAEAIGQFEELNRHVSLSPEQIERWGRLYLRSTDLDNEVRNTKAASIWKQLTEKEPGDPASAIRLAELLRAADMKDAALAEFRRAVKLAPESPEYHEYLGEYLHSIGRPNEAVAAWSAMAADNRRNAENLLRLTDVFTRHGYDDEAKNAIAAACKLRPTVNNLIHFSKLLSNAGSVEPALEQLERADQAATSTQEQDRILQERIQCLESGGLLRSRTAALADEVEQRKTPEGYLTLALYQESMGNLTAACYSVQQAGDREPDSARIAAVSARILEKAGLLAAAATANNRLLKLEPRNRTQRLQKIADLEHSLGRTDAALKAGRALIDAAPDNPEHYRSYAELCFSAGRTDEGLEALRESVRVNPTDAGSLNSLAQTLNEQFRTDEAIEIYWRLFGKSDTSGRRQATTRSMAALYLRKDRFGELIEELRNRYRQTADPILVYCIAAAHEAAGDADTARETLESLLSTGEPSEELLRELSILAEQSGDFRLAAVYQEQVNQKQPSVKGADRLANLLLRSGDIDLPESILMRYSGSDRLSYEVVAAIDQLIEKNDLQVALRLSDELILQDSGDWEARLRRAVIAWKLGDKNRTLKECSSILQIDLPADALPNHDSVARRKTGDGESKEQGSLGDSNDLQLPTPLRRLNRLQQFGRKLHLAGVAHGSAIAWEPGDFAEARAMALFLRLRAVYPSQKEAEGEIARMLGDATRQSPTKLAAWDAWHAVEAFRLIHTTPPDGAMSAAQLLANEPDAESQFAWLYSVANRTNGRFDDNKSVEPLSTSQVKALIAAFEVVRTRKPAWISFAGGVHRIQQELELVGRADQSREIVRNMLRPDASGDEIESVFDAAYRRSDLPLMLTAAERLGSDAATAAATSAIAWHQKYSLTALTAAELKNSEIIEESLRSFLKVRRQRSPTVSTAAEAESDGFKFEAAVHYQVYRNNAEAQPLMFRTLAFDPYLGRRDVEVLVNMREICRRVPDVDPLQVIREFRQSANGRTAATAELALAQILFMDRQEEDSVVHLVRAAELLPDNAVLRFRLATWFQQNDAEADALALLDTIKTTDSSVLREGELLALDLAAKLGNSERIALAADRLSGLRLNPGAVSSLADKLQTLGLNSRAKKLHARTIRATGTDVSSLAELMKQRADTGETDVAVEIAHELLRQTEGMSRGKKTGDSVESLRQAALSVLDKSGQLDATIERTRQQIIRSPDSESLHRHLLEFQVAAGHEAAATETRTRLNEIAPVTIDTLLKEAAAYEHAGKYYDASQKFLQVLSEDPHRFSQNYYKYLNTFRRGGLLPELADILLEHDIRKLQNNYYVVNETIRTLFSAAESDDRRDVIREKALKLFETAWDAFPNNRTFLMSEIQDASVWQLPLMVEHAANGLVPQTLQQVMASPWNIIAGRLSVEVSEPGKPARNSGTLTRLRAALQHHNKIPEFIQNLRPAVERFPHWFGGQLLLAVLLTDVNKNAEAASLLQKVVSETKGTNVPVEVASLVAAELQTADAALIPPLTQLLEAAIRGSTSAIVSNYDASAGRLLASLYAKEERHATAQAEILRTLQHSDAALHDVAASQSSAALRVEQYLAAGRHLEQLGYSVSAYRVFTEAQHLIGRTSSRTARAIPQYRRRAIEAMTTEQILDYLKMPTQTETDSLLSQTVSRLVLVRPTGDGDQIRSVLLDRLLQLWRQQAASEAIVSGLRRMLDADKAILPAIVAAVVLGSELQDTDLLKEGKAELMKYVAERDTPASADEVSLWLAARYAAFDESRTHVLIARSRSAAELLNDSRWLESLLREQGEFAIANGDPEAAEEAWTQLLDVVLASRDSGTATPDTSLQDVDVHSAVQELRTRLLK